MRRATIRKNGFTEEQIIAILREQETERGPKMSVAGRASAAPRLQLEARCGRLEVPEVRRLKTLEDENRRLKKLLAEAVFDVAVLKDLLAKMYGPPRLARLKMMCELALQQCIRPLVSELVFQPGRGEIRTARSWILTRARRLAFLCQFTRRR